MANRDPISSALETLLGRYGERVRQAGRKYGLRGEDVDEVVQEVRIRLWRALASGEAIAGATASYVYKAATSAALDLLRRRRSKREVSIEIEAPANPRPLLSAERREVAECVAAAVDAIVESRRPVVRMYLAGFDLREIMSAFGYSEPKARNLLYRGLEEMRERLTEMGIGPEALS